MNFYVNLKHKAFVRKRVTFFMLFTFMMMPFGTPAFAGLATVGVIDQATGFPTTITDTNGVTLGQCLDPFHCAADPSTFPFPTQPLNFPTNWPQEIFWFTANSNMDFASPSGGAGSAMLVLAVEGAFSGGVPAMNDQIMFSRIRLKVDGLIPGASYTVTHPYGTASFTTDAFGNGSVFTTEDCGIGIPGDAGSFQLILNCAVGPFLQWDLANPAVGKVGVLPPVGFIGSVAETNNVTGSPFGTNFFKIDGPGLGLNGVSTKLFELTGKISLAPNASNVIVKKATYTRPVVGVPQAQIFASSTDASTLIVSSSGGASSPILQSMVMKQAMNGLTPTADFFVNVDLTPDLGGNLPSAIIVSDLALNPPLNALSVPLVDVVNITEASFNQATGTLTVKASSSDAVSPLSLVVLDLPAPGNVLVGGSLISILSAPIDQVTVQSSQGGIATANVILSGPGSTDTFLPDFAAPIANAGVNRTVFLNSRVDLSAAQSIGTTAGYAWVQTAGPAVTLANPFNSDIHFIYPDVLPPALPPTLTFMVTLVGPGGTSSASVSVDAIAVPPVLPLIDSAQAKLSKDEWKVSGTITPVVPGTTVVSLIVTDSFGTTADLMDTIGGTVADTGPGGSFSWSSKGLPLTAGLTSGQWTIHAVSSTGTVGPSILVNVQ